MKRKVIRQWCALFIMLTLLFPCLPSLGSILQAAAPNGEVIVKYKGEAVIRPAMKNISLVNTWVFEDEEEGIYTFAHFASTGYETQKLVQLFEGLEGVVYVEPNGRCEIATLPSDPFVPMQWYIGSESEDVETQGGVNLHAQVLWDRIDEGEESVIAIIDTGVDYTHPDLAYNMWENKTTLPGKHGYNFRDQTDDPMDEIGHGTYCAGLIAAQVNNGQGIAGMSRQTKIMALKYMDETGIGKISDVIDAYKYVIEAKKQGVPVVAINNSWTSYENPKALEEIMETAGQNGMLSICAAGNEGINLDEEPMLPAAYTSPYIIVVGASTPDDQLASFSSYGKYTVDVMAPGTNMLTTYSKEAYIQGLNPGLLHRNEKLQGFEEEIAFTGEGLNRVNEMATEGSAALLWQIQPTSSEEAAPRTITLQMPPVGENYFLGFDFCSQIADESKAFIELEARQEGVWEKIGTLPLQNANFWMTRSFPIPKGATELRMTGRELVGDTKLYLDHMGIGQSTVKYAYGEGTSIAASIVASEVALLTNIFPEETPSRIGARIIGGVERSMVGLATSDGRIDMQRALENPYAVMYTLTESENNEWHLKGEFFGEQEGTVHLNDGTIDIVSWTDTEIAFRYAGDFDGYGQFKLTRADGQSSEQLLLVQNHRLDWTLHQPMPVALKNMSVASDNQFIYVMGGTLADGTVSKGLYCYEQGSDNWRQLSVVPDEEAYYLGSGSCATLWQEAIYIEAFNDVENKNDYLRYDLKNDSWEQLTFETMPDVRRGAVLITYKDAIYRVGGLLGDETLGQDPQSGAIWKLSKDQKTWEQVASLNEWRELPIVAVVNDTLIITGGRQSDSAYVTVTELFDGKKLQLGEGLPVSGLAHDNTIYGGGAKLYVMTDGSTFPKAGYIYDPYTNTWENSDLRLGHEKVRGMGSATINEKLYALGGEINYRTVDQVSSMPIELATQTPSFPYFIVGCIIVFIILLIVLLIWWIRKRRRPKKMFIR